MCYPRQSCVENFCTLASQREGGGRKLLLCFVCKTRFADGTSFPCARVVCVSGNGICKIFLLLLLEDPGGGWCLGSIRQLSHHSRKRYNRFRLLSPRERLNGDGICVYGSAFGGEHQKLQLVRVDGRIFDLKTKKSKTPIPIWTKTPDAPLTGAHPGVCFPGLWVSVLGWWFQRNQLDSGLPRKATAHGL